MEHEPSRHVLDLDAKYVPRPSTAELNKRLYEEAINKSSYVFRPELTPEVDNNLDRLVQRIRMNPGRFAANWVVGDRGSGKTQMLTEICFRLIESGTKRATRNTRQVLLPVFLPVKGDVLNSLSEGDIGETVDVYASMMEDAKSEMVSIFRTLWAALENGSLKPNSVLGMFAGRLPDDAKKIGKYNTDKFINFIGDLADIGVKVIFIFDDLDKVSPDRLHSLFSLRQTDFQNIRGSIVITARKTGFSELKESPGLNYLISTSSTMLRNAPDEFHMPSHISDPGFIREALKSRIKFVHFDENTNAWIFQPEKGSDKPWRNPDWPFSSVEKGKLDDNGLARIIHESRNSSEGDSMRQVLRFAQLVLEHSQDLPSPKRLHSPQVDRILEEQKVADAKTIKQFVEKVWEDKEFKELYVSLSAEEEFENSAIEAFDCIRFDIQIISMNSTDDEGVLRDNPILLGIREAQEKKHPFVTSLSKLLENDFAEDSTAAVLIEVFRELETKVIGDAIDLESKRLADKKKRKEGQEVAFDDLAKKRTHERKWLDELAESLEKFSQVDIFSLDKATPVDKEYALLDFARKLHDLLKCGKHSPPAHVVIAETNNLSQLTEGWKEFFKIRGMEDDPSWSFLARLLHSKINDAAGIVDHVEILTKAAQRPPLHAKMWKNFQDLGPKIDAITNEQFRIWEGLSIEGKESLTLEKIERLAGRTYHLHFSYQNGPVNIDSVSTLLTDLDDVSKKRGTPLVNDLPNSRTQLGEIFSYKVTLNVKDENDMSTLIKGLTRTTSEQIVHLNKKDEEVTDPLSVYEKTTPLTLHKQIDDDEAA